MVAVSVPTPLLPERRLRPGLSLQQQLVPRWLELRLRERQLQRLPQARQQEQLGLLVHLATH